MTGPGFLTPRMCPDCGAHPTPGYVTCPAHTTTPAPGNITGAISDPRYDKDWVGGRKVAVRDVDGPTPVRLSVTPCWGHGHYPGPDGCIYGCEL